MRYNNEVICFESITASGSNQGAAARAYLNFLTKEDICIADENLYVASKKKGKLSILEIKGTLVKDWSFDLLPKNCFWLHFQLHGSAQWNLTGNPTLSNLEYQGFNTIEGSSQIKLKAGKVGLVLIGIKIKNRTNFASEWTLLDVSLPIRQAYFPRMNIGYRIQQVLEKLRQYEPAPYSLQSKIRFHLSQLIEIYHADLKDKVRSLHKEDLELHRKALNYICAHFMEADLKISGIAKNLNVSERSLYRAFENKQTTIHSAIQAIRLYKGREMLRETNLSVDSIAYELHFSTGHYFYKQYVQRFGHSPTRERELHQKLAKQKKK